MVLLTLGKPTLYQKKQMGKTIAWKKMPWEYKKEIR